MADRTEWQNVMAQETAERRNGERRLSNQRRAILVMCQDWNIKPHRGRQRKVWSRIIDDRFLFTYR